MSTIVSWNGSSFTVPEVGEENWGGVTKVDGLLVSLAQNGLQKTGGDFTLSADLDFGGTAGLRALYYRTRANNAASSGVLRLANNENIGWRNQANNGNILVGVDTNNFFNINADTVITTTDGVAIRMVKSGSDTYSFRQDSGTGMRVYNVTDGREEMFFVGDGSVNFSAYTTGIAHLGASGALTSSLIVNADVNAAAAIAYSKLALSNSIVNADIAAAAAIAYSKLAALTASRALVSDGSGVVSVSAVTSTEVGFVAGLTSSAVGTTQTQTLSGKTFSDAVTLTQISTPSSPASGKDKLYTKSGDGLYWLDSSGVEHSATEGGYRNYVINGNFDFWQRQTSISGFAATSKTYNSADCWCFIFSAGSCSASITRDSSSPPTGSRYALKCQRTAGNAVAAVLSVVQGVETADITALQGKAITFRFYAKRGANYSVASNNLEIAILSGTGTDESPTGSLTGSSTLINVQSALTTSYQLFEYTGTFPSTGTEMSIQFKASFTGTAGADDSFYVTQVALYAGSPGAPFQLYGRNISGELVACQRRYEKSYQQSEFAGAVSNTSALQAMGIASGKAHTTLPFKVTKRTGNPTVTVYSTNGPSGKFRNATAGADLTATQVSVGDNFCTYESADAFTAGDRILYQFEATSDL